MSSRKLILLFALVLTFVIVGILPGSQLSPIAGAASSVTLKESNDFATLVLRDPWDMSEFTDISQYLNTSGQFNNLQNIQVQGGIFSAQSTSAADPQFMLLFPGYRISQALNAINVGKVGQRFPIGSSAYHCLYVAMQVNSSSSDYYQVLWFADDHMNDGTSPWGYSNYLSISPSIWKLYSVDLASAFLGGTPWTGNATWQGLRFDPSIQANVGFAIDWSRLTDCSQVNTTISWSGTSVRSLWLTSASTGNSILVQTGLSGSSTILDTEGVAAGTYQICLSSSSNSCNSVATPNPTSLTINQAPVATFNRPSPWSGVDYATQAGNPWDFVDGSDLAPFTPQNVSLSFANGLMNMTTASAPLPNGADPRFYLNAPQQISSGSQYRYLTYHMYTQWPSQNVPGAMIVRWIWGMNATGPATGCEMVSYDIPYDVGWQTYSVDLSDPYNGSVEATAGSCPPGPYSWSTSGPIGSFRWKPNENNLGQNLFQQLDWVRLTQVDSVAHGTPFPITISLDKLPQGVTFNFYYTTNQAQPTQYRAAQAAVPLPPPPPGRFVVYLPMIENGTANSKLPPVVNGVTFSWDTTLVNPGTYFICVVADDSYNTTTFCSEAPVVVK